MAAERQSFETLDIDDLDEVLADESGLRRMPAEPNALRAAGPPPLPRRLPPPLPVKVIAEPEASERLDFDGLVEDLSSRPAPVPASGGWDLRLPPLPAPAPVPAPPGLAPRRAGSAWTIVSAVGIAAFLVGLGTMWLVQRQVLEVAPALEVASEPTMVVLDPIVIAAEAPTEVEVALVDPIVVPAEPVRAVAPRRAIVRPQAPREAVVAEPAPVEQDRAGLPESPAREDVLAAMAAARPAIEACASDADRGRLARVRFSFSSAGRPVHTNVEGVSGPTASCVARTARRVRVPPFARDHFVIEFPFQL